MVANWQWMFSLIIIPPAKINCNMFRMEVAADGDLYGHHFSAF